MSTTRRFNKTKTFATLLISTVLIGGNITACGETKDAESFILEAKQYQQAGDDNAAIIQLKNALQQAPNDAEARYLLGSLYVKAGDPRSAENELNRALDLGMDADKILTPLAETLLSLGEFQQVLDKTEEASKNGASEDILILRGNASLALGHHQDAKALFDQVLAEHPDSPEALIGLARYSLLENDIETAMQLSEQAVAKNPENVIAWQFRADLLRSQGEIDEAMVAYSQVISLDSDNVTAHISQATVQINRGKFDAAKSSIEAAREISPESLMVVYTQGLLDFTQGKHAEALESIQQVLSVAPGHMPTILLSGATQLALGSLAQAEQHLKRYLEKDPNSLYARKLLASALLRDKQAQQAADILKPALGTSQDPQLLALAGETFMQTGDFEKANDLFERANTLVPDNAALHTALGMSQLALGDSEHAIVELEKAASMDTSSPRAGILLAVTHLRLKEFDKALSAIETLEKEEPDNPLYQNLKGGVYLGKEDVTSARASFNKAVALQPDYYPAAANLARLDLQDNKPDAAKNRFEAILKTDQKNIQAMTALANLALSQEDTDNATKWFELASSQNPDVLQPSIQLTAYYLRSGEKEKALALAQRLFNVHSDEASVLEVLAQSQFANDNKPAALEHYIRLAGLLPESAAAQFQIASVQASMQDFPAASAALRRALEIKPDYLDAEIAQVRLAVQNNNSDDAITISRNIQKQHEDSPIGALLEGELLMQQGKAEAALKAYEKAFTITQSGPLMVKVHAALSQTGKDKEAATRITKWLADNANDATTRLYVAGFNLENGQYDAATKQYETILQQHPDHAMTLNNLAWLYQQNKDPRALSHAERAYKQAPEAPAILDTLGWILVGQGESTRALPVLQKAVSLAPDAHEIRYHLAVALAKSGDKEKAQEELKQLLALENSFSETEAAKDLLKQLQE